MRVAVVTSSPPMTEGGHLVIARALVNALREEGHEAEIVITPQNRCACTPSWRRIARCSGTTRCDGCMEPPSSVPSAGMGF